MRDEISLMADIDQNGGCEAEFAIQWPRNTKYPHIIMHDDAWGLLHDWQDVFEALAKLHDTNATPKQVIFVLAALGFEDDTPTTRPADAVCPTCGK